MQRRTTIAALALTATVSVLAGCGGSSGGSASSGGSTGGGGGSNNSSQSPGAELTSAVGKLTSASTLTTTLRIGGSASQIESFAASQGTTISQGAANSIAGASVSIESQKGTGFQVTITVSGKALISLRDVSSTIYLQTDLKDLLGTIGQSSTYQELQGSTSGLPVFAQKLIQGGWVSIPSATVKSLTGGSTSSSSGSTGGQGGLLSILNAALANDVTATRVSSGSTDTLKLTANTRTIAKDVSQAAATAIPVLGSALSGSVGSAPNKNLTMTATVNGGALSSLSIDLAQLAKKATSASLPIELDFAESGSSISAPSGATAVDPSTLQSLLGAVSSGGGL